MNNAMIELLTLWGLFYFDNMWLLMAFHLPGLALAIYFLGADRYWMVLLCASLGVVGVFFPIVTLIIWALFAVVMFNRLREAEEVDAELG